MIADNLEKIIDQLINTPILSSKTELTSILSNINKYSENETERAYLLGIFFKKEIDSDKLPTETKKRLLDSIKHHNLEKYYYQKEKPVNEQLNALSFIFLIGGFCSIILGIVQLAKGNLTISTNLRYLTSAIQNGGYKIILGIILFVTGFVRFRHELLRRAFMRHLTSN